MLFKIHELKTINPYFNDVWGGIKNFEIRKNDRDFKINDWIVLKEYDSEKNIYSGREITVYITYILNDFHAIKENYCIISFKTLELINGK